MKLSIQPAVISVQLSLEEAVEIDDNLARVFCLGSACCGPAHSGPELERFLVQLGDAVHRFRREGA